MERALADSSGAVLTLDPLALEVPAGDLPEILRALARHPALLEELEVLKERVEAAAASPSPTAWLGVMKSLEVFRRLPGLELPSLASPLPTGDQARAFRSALEEEFSRVLAWKPLVGEFRRRMGGRKALVGRVLAEAADLLEEALAEEAVRPRARLLSAAARFGPEGVVLPELDFAISSRSLARFFSAPALADEEEEFQAPREEGLEEGREEGGMRRTAPARVVLFAATIGPGMEERARAAFARGEPFAGTVLDALGSTFAEGAARAVGEEAARRGLLGEGGPGSVVRRYHSGYGDWPLAGQADLFRLLEPQAIGIALTESFLMVPEKSVAGLAAWKRRLS